MSKEHSWRNALISIEIALRFLPPAPLHFRSLFSRTNTRMKEERPSEARDEKEGKLITYFESIQVVYRNLSSTLYQRVCRFRCCSFLQTRSTLMLPSFALFFCYVLYVLTLLYLFCAQNLIFFAFEFIVLDFDILRMPVNFRIFAAQVLGEKLFRCARQTMCTEFSRGNN